MIYPIDNVIADVLTAPISPEHSETVELKILLRLTLIHFLIQWSLEDIM
jgi:hypothetical protein